MSGKAYLNRKPIQSRHCGDLYDTPMSLVWALVEKMPFFNILEPASGNGSIIKALEKYHDKLKPVKHGDISTG